MLQPHVELARALREFTTELIRATRSDELSRTAASTLSTLDRQGPSRITALAELEAVTQPAMTGLVQRLEAGGLVTRSADASDGRVTLVSVTDLGMETLQRRRDAQDRIIGERLAALSPEHLASLEAALPALLTVMESHVV